MSTKPLFKRIENMHDLFRGKGCTRKFCELFRKQSGKILKRKNEE